MYVKLGDILFVESSNRAAPGGGRRVITSADNAVSAGAHETIVHRLHKLREMGSHECTLNVFGLTLSRPASTFLLARAFTRHHLVVARDTRIHRPVPSTRADSAHASGAPAISYHFHY